MAGEFFFFLFFFANWTSRRAIVRRKQGLRQPFQYQLKWQLRSALAFGYTRRVYSRVVQTLCRTSHLKAKGTNSTDWNCPFYLLFSFFSFFYFFLSFSRGWRSVIRVSLHITMHRIDATDNLTNEKASKWRLRVPFREIGFYVSLGIITFRWR